MNDVSRYERVVTYGLSFSRHINVAYLEYGRRANEEPEQETMDEDAEDTMYEKNDPAGKAFNPTSINEHFGIFTNDTTAAMHRGACT